jgi:hypothetical protein
MTVRILRIVIKALTIFFFALSCSQVFAVWNEGYFLIEKAYQQTSDGSVNPLNNQNVRLRLTIRNTTANQTSLISYINALGGTSTLNPIRDGQLIGAHYNLLFGFSNFDELKASYPPGNYNLSLIRTYSGSTVNLNPTYSFSGNDLSPTIAPILTGGTWSNGILQFTNRVMTINWQPWTNALNSNSTIGIEITQRGGGGAGGGLRSVYNSPIVWSNLSSNTIYDAELQFMNLEMKTSLSDPQQGDGQEFRLYHVTTTKFAFKTGTDGITGGGSTSTTNTNIITPPTNTNSKTLLSGYTNRFEPNFYIGESNLYHIQWFAEDKLQYQVQESVNLQTWANFRGQMTGGGFTTEITWEPSNDKAFYRLVRSGDYVIEAKYGADTTLRDVTSYVTSLKQTYNGSFVVSNSRLGGDPIFGKVKTLYVTIAKPDGVYLYTAREGATINLNQ